MFSAKIVFFLSYFSINACFFRRKLLILSVISPILAVMPFLTPCLTLCSMIRVTERDGTVQIIERIYDCR